MILIDASLLLYATRRNSDREKRARNWLDAQLSGDTRVGIPWTSLLAYLRIATNPRVFSRAGTTRSAWRQIEEWLDCDCVWIPAPGAAHRSHPCQVARPPRRRSQTQLDAHLAALAIEHGLTLCSSDGDFARFKGLRWLDPLAP